MNDVSKDVTVVKSVVKMPIRAKPYEHQIKAFNFAMEIFCNEGGDVNDKCSKK